MDVGSEQIPELILFPPHKEPDGDSLSGIFREFPRKGFFVEGLLQFIDKGSEMESLVIEKMDFLRRAEDLPMAFYRRIWGKKLTKNGQKVQDAQYQKTEPG
jgi:hypothetical protein